MKEPEEKMTVELDFGDEGIVECEVMTIREVNGRDYIFLVAPEDANGNDREVYFYRYSENPDDPNEEPVLEDILDDDEFDAVNDAFEEFLDENEYDSL